jgi:hypothetical protein
MRQVRLAQVRLGGWRSMEGAVTHTMREEGVLLRNSLLQTATATATHRRGGERANL